MANKAKRAAALLGAAAMVAAAAGAAHAGESTVTDDDPAKTTIDLVKLHVDNGERVMTMTATAKDLPGRGSIVFEFSAPKGSAGGGVKVVKKRGKPVEAGFFATPAGGKPKVARCAAGTAGWSTASDTVEVSLPQRCWSNATGQELPRAWWFSATVTQGKRYDMLVTATVKRG